MKKKYPDCIFIASSQCSDSLYLLKMTKLYYGSAIPVCAATTAWSIFRAADKIQPSFDQWTCLSFSFG